MGRQGPPVGAPGHCRHGLDRDRRQADLAGRGNRLRRAPVRPLRARKPRVARCGAGFGPAPITIAAMELNWIALVLVVLGLYLAFKLIGAALKLVMWLVVLVGAYWFVAPALGWPTVSDLVYAFGPDFEGQ